MTHIAPKRRASRRAAPSDEQATIMFEAACGDRPMRTVTIGSVTVRAPEPTEAEVKRNVELSTQALERLAHRLVRPGVRLPRKKGVPLYSADEDTPGVFVRLLNGKRERGVLEDGEFKPI